MGVNWSYAPYRPFFTEVGDPYICRVAPSVDSIHIEWIGGEGLTKRVRCRERGADRFAFFGETTANAFDLTGLTQDADFEFYVETDEGKSRVRLARTGDYVGAIVNYLHPDDDAYAFSGHYLCSPSLLPLSDGSMLASMDLYAGGYPQNLTLIFRSEDGGESWHYLCELFPAFWTKLFEHDGAVYALACSTEYGDLLIGRSDDGGKTFGEPTVLLRGSNGKNGEAGVHKNPQSVLCYGGRLWNTLEWGAWGSGYHAAMVMSALENADLLDADSWTFSEPVRYNPDWEGVPQGESTGNIEGCLVPLKDGLYNFMRYDMTRMHPNFGKIIAYRVDTKHPEKPLQFWECVDFPANHSKFQILQSPTDGKFRSIASRITDEAHSGARNLLSLMVSDDALNWQLERDLIDRREDDPKAVGFQYVDMHYTKDSIMYLCRTAMNGAHNFHDSNCITFHRTEA